MVSWMEEIISGINQFPNIIMRNNGFSTCMTEYYDISFKDALWFWHFSVLQWLELKVKFLELYYAINNDLYL